jgi:LmbE family N-acetylglucosaminyl deacetylase
MPLCLLVFAHADDEAIALGARLARFATANLLDVTDSAPADGDDARAHGFESPEAYGRARQQELADALRLAGIAGVRRECLGYADQSATRNLVNLTLDLLCRMQAFRPDVVFTHPYEGGHPDHDACAFAVHHGVAMYQQESGGAPLIIEGTSYHLGANGIETGVFLPTGDAVEQMEYVLSEAEQRHKQAVLRCFRTQQVVLEQFKSDVERFRIAPAYDFTRPPHLGPVFYDHHSWGMDSARFCRLACEAEAVLATMRVNTCR